MALQSKGNFMCFMRARSATPKGETRHQYGVLLHNLTEESYFGTCLMTDGGYLTLSWDLLHQSFKRITEWELRLTPPKQKELRDLYIKAIADTTALELRITQSQSEYNQGIERVRIAREAKREAAAAAKLKIKPPAKKKPKKLKISGIRLNTHVAMFFTWEELESPHPRPTRVPDKDGKIDIADQWRCGTVTNIVQNQWRKKVYTCVFDTPGKFTSPYNAQEILVARENFIKLKSDFPGVEDSSSDDFSTSDDERGPQCAAPVVANARRKAAGLTVTIPGTQPEDDAPPVKPYLAPNDGLALPEEQTTDPTILKEVEQVAETKKTMIFAEDTNEVDIRKEVTEESPPARSTNMIGGTDQTKEGDVVQHATPTVVALTSTASAPKEEIAERNLATAKEVVEPATTKLIGEETKEEDKGKHMTEESPHMTGASPYEKEVGDLVQHATLPVLSTSIQQGLTPIGSHPTPTSPKEEALTSTASAPKEEAAERNSALAAATTTEQVKEVYVGTTTQVPAATLTPNEPKDNTATATNRPESVDTEECEDSTQPWCESSSEGTMDSSQDAALLLQSFKAGEQPYCKDALKGSKKIKPRKRKSNGIKGVIRAPSQQRNAVKKRARSGINTPHEPKDNTTKASMPPESANGENHVDRPRGLYTAANKHLRKRVFPCPCCSDAADGSHQCGACFQHVHVFCASQYKDSPEGFGQILSCGQCDDTAECKDSTQAGHDRNSQAKTDVTEDAALVIQASEAGGQSDGKDAMKERKRLELANYFTQSTTVKDGDEVNIRKRKRNGSKAAITRSGSGKETADDKADDSEAVVPVPPETEPTAIETFADYYTNTDNIQTWNNGANEDSWENDDYYWDEQYSTWVYMPRKRIRRKDLTNKKEKNWALSMRRNWASKKKDKIMAKITIKRDKLDTVTFTQMSFYDHSHSNIILCVVKVYRRLYEDGVCIVEDFFDYPTEQGIAKYPPPLFKCPDEQAIFITKPGISREIIFDGVRRSSTSCGYDTHIVEEKKNNTKRKIAGPVQRQQLKPCKVVVQSNH